MARVDSANRVRYWQGHGVPGLRLLHADFTRHDYTPHFHEALVVAVTEIGGSEFRSRGVVQEAGDRSLMVFNPVEPHSGRMGRSPRWRYRSFYLRQPAIDQVAALVGIDGTPYFTGNLVPDAALVESFLRLHRAFDTGEDPLRIAELLTASFGSLIARHGGEGRRVAAVPRDRVAIADALALIHDEHTRSLTLEDLGRVSGLTAFQLIRLFKRVTGLTPHGYLTQVRLGVAARQLERGVTPVETALAVGFYDQSALTRHFKQAYGLTPARYARAMRG